MAVRTAGLTWKASTDAHRKMDECHSLPAPPSSPALSACPVRIPCCLHRALSTRDHAALVPDRSSVFSSPARARTTACSGNRSGRNSTVAPRRFALKEHTHTRKLDHHLQCLQGRNKRLPKLQKLRMDTLLPTRQLPETALASRTRITTWLRTLGRTSKRPLC